MYVKVFKVIDFKYDSRNSKWPTKILNFFTQTCYKTAFSAAEKFKVANIKWRSQIAKVLYYFYLSVLSKHCR